MTVGLTLRGNSIEPNLYHLRYFVVAAELGSLAAASKILNVSQPAISQAIRKLEDTFDCALLLHTRNRFKLTQEGQELVLRGIQLLEQVALIKADIKGLQTELSGELVIATSTEIAQFLLPPLLKKFKKEFPQVRPVLKLGSAQFIAEQVRKGEADLGLAIDDGQVRGVHKVLLHEGGFDCVARSGIVNSPAQAEFLVTKESPGLLELEKAYHKAFRKKAAISMEVESWVVIAQLASQGLGVGFLPDFIAAKLPGLRSVDSFQVWSSKIKYRHYLLHQGPTQLSKAARAFIPYLK